MRKIKTPYDYHAELMQEFVTILVVTLGVGTTLALAAMVWWLNQ